MSEPIQLPQSILDLITQFVRDQMQTAFDERDRAVTDLNNAITANGSQVDALQQQIQVITTERDAAVQKLDKLNADIDAAQGE